MNGIINAINRIVQALKSVFINREAAHEKIHDGDHFYLKSFTDIAVENTDFTLTTFDSDIDLHIVGEFVSEGEFEVYLYRDGTVSAEGAAVDMLNRHHGSSKTTIQLYAGPTITALGTLIWSGKVGTGRVSGGEIRSSTELVLDRDTRYIFRLKKIGAGVLWFDFLFDWYHQKRDAHLT